MTVRSLREVVGLLTDVADLQLKHAELKKRDAGNRSTSRSQVAQKAGETNAAPEEDEVNEAARYALERIREKLGQAEVASDAD